MSATLHYQKVKNKTFFEFFGCMAYLQGTVACSKNEDSKYTSSTKPNKL